MWNGEASDHRGKEKKRSGRGGQNVEPNPSIVLVCGSRDGLRRKLSISRGRAPHRVAWAKKKNQSATRSRPPIDSAAGARHLGLSSLISSNDRRLDSSRFAWPSRGPVCRAHTQHHLSTLFPHVHPAKIHVSFVINFKS